jgi:release factor glutamine methyltransferase
MRQPGGLYSRLHDPLTPRQQAEFDALVARRLAHEPTPYITGHKEFFDLNFEVTPTALIPRPETELLVEEALAAARQWQQPPTTVDVGCGCGAVACTLAHHLTNSTIYATA